MLVKTGRNALAEPLQSFSRHTVVKTGLLKLLGFSLGIVVVKTGMTILNVL